MEMEFLVKVSGALGDYMKIVPNKKLNTARSSLGRANARRLTWR